MRLGIITQNNVIGLIEITDNLPKRLNSIHCISKEGSAFFMPKDRVLHCYQYVNFKAQIAKERQLKANSYINRIVETFDF